MDTKKRTNKKNQNQKNQTSQPVSEIKEMVQTKEQNERFNLNMETYKLLCSEPFFAAVSRYVTKIESRSVPTAGVTVDKKTCNFIMYYNPDFFKLLTPVEKLGVLKHEYYHLILEHVTGRKPTNVNDHKTWNYATDLAINSFLSSELPSICLHPGKGIFKDYPAKQAAEWYFKKLQQDERFKIKSPSESGDGDQQFDDHGQWEEADGSANSSSGDITKELANERLKDVLRKAAQEVVNSGNNWGTISAEMRKEILDRISSKIDWRKVLRFFIKTSQRADKQGTIRKINKRYAYIHPGRKVNRHAKIAVCIDQSGSVSDQMLVAFFSELNALSELAEFTVVPFDHEIAPPNKIYVWKKGTHHRTERVLTGGTCFNAPTKYVNDSGDFDACIILTDLQAPKPIPCKVQRLWITSEECAKQPYFQTSERILAIPIGRTQE